ncbi:TIGR00180 family glycosyltransferase [Methanosarcina sp. T3]|uniref:TIGR00180 family glycosyltransferase n=1 Tax=Methanosarcina sp. T3 TaxID=3439062 RepID=UPI003F85427F
MDSIGEFYADKDLNLLKKLTVVIPTYNRNYYLSRCLWYHSHFPFGEIIVADSSPEGKKVVNREIVRKLVEERGANIRYLEYLPETEKYGGDIVRKWGDAVQHVETQYSQTCTDKEFLNPMTLCKCIAFLDEHADYDMAAGPRYNIKSSKSGDIEFFEASPGRSLSIDYPDSLARLLVFSTSLPDTFNIASLRRSHVHKRVYNKLFESEINDLRFGELGLELFSVISSKSIYFPGDPHIYRDTIKLYSSHKIKRSTPESSATRYPLLEEYLQTGLYTDYMDHLSSCLAHEYLSSSSSEMTVKDAQDLMRIAILNLQKIRGFFANPSSDISRCGSLILTCLPTEISTYVRRVLNRPVQSPLADIPDDFQIITQILIRTLYLHKEDKAIPLNP